MKKSTHDSDKFLKRKNIININKKNINHFLDKKNDLKNISTCCTLIIDENQTSRTILVDMLRPIGLRDIIQCTRLPDARKELERKTFDFVFCDYYFSNSIMTGQDLLEDLRRNHILPYSTAFIMLSSEASYQKVAEVAECALDGYLLRPHTTATLQDRLLHIYYRKKILSPVFDAIKIGDFESAAKLCLQRFNQRGQYWLYAARIGAELQIRLGHHNEARELYEAVQEAKALPWAKLGIARVQIEEGQYPAAKRTLESLIGEQPTYVDAYDVMGRLQIDRGDFQGAMATYRNATQLTPSSIPRLQKNGFLAFLIGDIDAAIDVLEKAVRTGICSKMFDCQTLVFLCMIYFIRQDGKSFMRAHDHLENFYQKSQNSIRLRQFYTICKFFKLINQKKIAEGVAAIREIASEITLESFDFESAINLMATLAVFSQAEIALEDTNAWVTKISHRFCVSKASTEMLQMAALNHTMFIHLIQEGYKYICKDAESAISHSLTGNHLTAVKALMVTGSKTKNAKILQLASKVLQRHGHEMKDVDSMIHIINDLQVKYCSQGVQISMESTTSRPAGGVHLRTSSS